MTDAGGMRGTIPPMVHKNINDGTARGGKILTKGEYRVGIDFNPSGNAGVNHIKQAAAALIDLIEEIPDQGEGEIKRLKAEAQTAAENMAMWAVKAVTKKPQG
jgi:hypothetical protein